LAESSDAEVFVHLLEGARILRALARGALGLNVEQVPGVGEWIKRDQTYIATGRLPARKRTKKGKPHEKETR
jgi:hypothetical protein